jgi:hypothetical protein
VRRRHVRRTHDEVDGARSARRLARGSAPVRRRRCRLWESRAGDATRRAAAASKQQAAAASGKQQAAAASRKQQQQQAAASCSSKQQQAVAASSSEQQQQAAASSSSKQQQAAAASSSKQQQQAAASSSKQHDDVGRRSEERPERRTLCTMARSARVRRSRRRDQGTAYSRLGAALATIVVLARVSNTARASRSAATLGGRPRAPSRGRRSKIHSRRRRQRRDDDLMAAASDKDPTRVTQGEHEDWASGGREPPI